MLTGIVLLVYCVGLLSVLVDLYVYEGFSNSMNQIIRSLKRFFVMICVHIVVTTLMFSIDYLPPNLIMIRLS